MRPHLPAGHRWDIGRAILDIRRVARDTEIPFCERMCGSFLCIGDGLAYSFSVLADGHRHIDDIFGPGSMCNWNRSLRPALPYALMVKGGSHLVMLDGSQLLRALDDDPCAAEAFRRLDLSRQWRQRQRARTLISGAVLDGLMHVLLDLMFEIHGSFERFEPVRIPMTQEEISAILGSSAVHLNRMMKKLEADGRVRRRNRIFEIVDPMAERRRLAYDTPSFPAITADSVPVQKELTA